MEDTQTAVVLGSGPGLGASVARRFARGGYAVALMARDATHLRDLRTEVAALGVKALALSVDGTDARSVATAFATVREQLGAPEVFVYNAGAFVAGGVLDLSPEDFERCWRANCFGGFLGAREVVPGMLARGRGTLLFTGASAGMRGSARFAALAVGKFGLRALAQSLARELGPRGIHVAHVVIDGQIENPRLQATAPGHGASVGLAPDAIAETYWQLHVQPASAWTQELDLRPNVEKF